MHANHIKLLDVVTSDHRSVSVSHLLESRHIFNAFQSIAILLHSECTEAAVYKNVGLRILNE